MPIKGLSDRGMSFPEIGQIRKGAKKSENAPGKDLTYFRVEFDERETVAAQQFAAIYGEQPTAIRIILPFNQVERMWDAWLEAYTAGRMVARSDGERIIYQVSTKTGEVEVANGVSTKDGTPRVHPENNVAGYDSKNKPIMFKASGRLKVIIPELARAAYLTVLTTSKHDIANISDQLRAFAELNHDQIAGIPFILRRRPKKISVPKPDGSRARMTKWMLSIEADPDWVKAKLMEVKRLALPGNGLALMSGVIEHEEPEIEGTPDDLVDDDEIIEGEVTEPEAQPEPKPIVYPEHLEAIVNSKGVKYTTLDSDTLAILYDDLAKASKTKKSQEELALISVKMQTIREINALRASTNGG